MTVLRLNQKLNHDMCLENHTVITKGFKLLDYVGLWTAWIYTIWERTLRFTYERVCLIHIFALWSLSISDFLDRDYSYRTCYSEWNLWECYRGRLVDAYRYLHKEPDVESGFSWSGNPIGKWVDTTVISFLLLRVSSGMESWSSLSSFESFIWIFFLLP